MMFKHHTIHIHQVRNESESYQNFSRILIYSNFRLNIEPQQQYHFRCPKQGYIVSVQLNRNCNGDKCQHKPQRGMHEEFIFLPILPQPKNQS